MPFRSSGVSEGWFGQGVLLSALYMFSITGPNPANDEVLIVGLSSLKMNFAAKYFNGTGMNHLRKE